MAMNAELRRVHSTFELGRLQPAFCSSQWVRCILQGKNLALTGLKARCHHVTAGAAVDPASDSRPPAGPSYAGIGERRAA